MDRVDVDQIEEPPVGGQRAPLADDLVAGLPFELLLGGGNLHGADFGVGEHLGAVADAIVEHLAGVVELGGKGRGKQQQERREQRFGTGHHDEKTVLGGKLLRNS